ncbi:hypothetical protein [Nodularia sp. UHCC 0506]|uniref:hypothetical protein n=1 Tax=Nodularia sp. UHCC 0506 TaxID=3110243 RepID=UPI002B1FA151|nr:hypothetical protein [Nodularia sp. UHCC 0506]MEA5516552.1 hypothetical protein [Nodularia sp. UHCC 0506]
MKTNKNTSFFKILTSLVGVASVSTLMSVPAFALTNLTKYTTDTIHSQAVPPTNDTAPGTQPSKPGESEQPGQPGESEQPDQPGDSEQPGQPGSEQD